MKKLKDIYENLKGKVKNNKVYIKIRKKIECRKLKKVKKEEREIIEGKVEVIN